MREIILLDEIKYGMKNKHTIMNTGEKRFRQICMRDKTAYIRAEGGNKGYWQKSHYHKYVKEIYIVQKGSILLAQYIDGKVHINKVNEDETFIVFPNTPHNVYMYPNTITHTVKYGEGEEYDWEAFEKLDDKLKEKKIDINQFDNNEKYVINNI